MCIYFYIISYCSCPHDVKLPHQTPAALPVAALPHPSPPGAGEEAGWVGRLTGRRCKRAADLASAAVAAVSRSKDGL